MTPDSLLRVEGWARDGLTNEQIAHNIGIRCETLYDWCNKFPNFSNALKKGKAPVDIEVENALYKRAMGGFEVKEKRIEKWKDANGNEREHTIIITREVPPDTTAIIYWLNNRKPQQWRNRREYEKSGADDPLMELFRRMDADARNVQPKTERVSS